MRNTNMRTPEEKEKILEEYLSGETGIREMERKYNINHSIIYRWLEN